MSYDGLISQDKMTKLRHLWKIIQARKNKARKAEEKVLIEEVREARWVKAEAEQQKLEKS